MKKGILLAFFLTIPFFSCAKVSYYKATVTNTFCSYQLSEEQVADNKDYVITFTPDFGRHIYEDDDNCLKVFVGGLQYFYDVYEDDKPWTFVNNVLTIRARIITGDIEVIAVADIVSDEYKITYDCGDYTLDKYSHESGDFIQIDGKDFYLTFKGDVPSSLNNFVITPSDNRFNQSACVYNENTFSIPKAQLGCDIKIEVK